MGKRSNVAREAARLLYSGAAEEYIQAKEMAAASLGVKGVPSNYEVAVELDHLADETEGGERQRRLAEMRKIALGVMRRLVSFSPRLIGSVWRGTARKGSDIDVVALARSPSDVENALREYKIKDERRGQLQGRRPRLPLQARGRGGRGGGRRQEPRSYTEDRCDIYGDVKRGITLPELERLLRVDPLRRFVPRRRSR